MTQLHTINGPTPVVYLEGSQIDEKLTGVFFEIRAEDGKIVCPGVHSDVCDHMIQYTPDQRADFCAKAAQIAANDDPIMYAPSGFDAWAA